MGKESQRNAGSIRQSATAQKGGGILDILHSEIIKQELTVVLLVGLFGVIYGSAQG